jgi:hypothetical protein
MGQGYAIPILKQSGFLNFVLRVPNYPGNKTVADDSMIEIIFRVKSTSI